MHETLCDNLFQQIALAGYPTCMWVPTQCSPTVTIIQLELFSITTMHPFESSIFGILFIIMIPFFTPVVEVSLFSFIYFILWAMVIASFVKALRKWISRVKILYSQKKSKSS